MKHVNPTYWGLLCLTLSLYLIMVFWSLPTLKAASGGLIPFDLRAAGYSDAEARLYLTELSNEGREFYLNVQQKLDFVFPLLLALTLGFALRGLFRKTWLRNVLVLLPFTASAFDYVENSRIAAMLNSPVKLLSAEQVAMASQATVLKFVFISVSLAVTLIGLGFYWQRQRQVAA